MAHRRHHQQGFTLIELMIVVVIVGILAAIAYPSFRQYGIRTNRTAAKTVLAQNSQFMEREFTATGRYDDAADPGTLRTALPNDQAPADGNAAYNIAATNLSSTTFTLTATPRGNQAEDTTCGILSLTHNGIRCVNNGASCSNVPAQQAAVDACW
ncbi:MAG: type IV pilin protein [Gammaproteobacteria bacterium]|nr:type IV pilin protein [Gammaproteobacteria bacterium]